MNAAIAFLSLWQLRRQIGEAFRRTGARNRALHLQAFVLGNLRTGGKSGDQGGGGKPSVNLGQPILDLVGGKPVQDIDKALPDRAVPLAQQRRTVGQRGTMVGFGHFHEGNIGCFKGR